LLIKGQRTETFTSYAPKLSDALEKASNSLNKWLKKDFDGLTAHCLRHTFRDRLRAVECPLDLIDQIGGWKSVSSIGNSYGKGYTIWQIKKIIEGIRL